MDERIDWTRPFDDLVFLYSLSSIYEVGIGYTLLKF